MADQLMSTGYFDQLRRPVPRVQIIGNALLFQAAWFAAILYGWQAALGFVILLGVQNAYFCSLPALAKLGVIMLSGISIDTLFYHLDIYRFGEAEPNSGFVIPVWLCLLWIGFAFTLLFSLSALLRLRGWFILLCTLAGPLSYWAGMRLGALIFSVDALVSIALEWLIVSTLALRMFLSGPSAKAEATLASKAYGKKALPHA